MRLLALLAALPLALSITLPLVQHRSPSPTTARSHTVGASFYKGTVNAASSTAANDTEGVSTDADLVYIAQIDIGGTQLPVQIDTGSSDLWVKPSTALSSVTQSTVFINMSYGIGYTAGLVAQADVQFASYDLPSQAFILASSASNPILQYGAVGIVGLGFTALSQVDMSVNETGASWGRSLLYNAFAQKPGEPNFISFVLQRSEDPSEATQGSLTIGEYVPEYAGIQGQAMLATVPAVNPDRWTVALDAIETASGNMTGFTSVVASAPSGKAVALLDSGTSYAYVTSAIAQAIYGSVSGASLDTSAQQWTLPCDAQVTVAFWFAGQRVYIHPLDSNREVSNNSCIGTFLPQSLAVGGSSYDVLLGDVFLRNVYSLYDFGDTDSSGTPTSGPYVQLLGITDELTALQEFVAIRGGTVPASVAQSTDTASGSGSTDAPSAPTLSTEDQMSTNITQLLNYVPALLGLLALNTLFLLLLVGVGCVLCLRWRRKGKPSRGPSSSGGGPGGKPAYKPVALETGTREAYDSEAPYSHDGEEGGTGGDNSGVLDPPKLPYDPRQSVFNPRLSMIRGNMSQTSIDRASMGSGGEDKRAPSPSSPGGTTLVASSAMGDKRFSTMQPSIGAIEEHEEHPGSLSLDGSNASSSSPDQQLTTPPNERDSFLAPPVMPFHDAGNGTGNRMSIAGLPPLPMSRPNSMLAPLAGDPAVLLATSTPERNRLSALSIASSTLEPPAPPFAPGAAQARRDRDRSPSPGRGSLHSASGSGSASSPTQALITLETPEKEHSTLEPPNPTYAHSHGHGRNDSLSKLPPLPMSRPGSMLVPSNSEPMQMAMGDSRRLSRLDAPGQAFGDGQRRRSSADRSPSPSPSPTRSAFPTLPGGSEDTSPTTKRASVFQQLQAVPMARPPPNRAMPPRPLSLVDSGAAGPPRPRMLSPRLAESRPVSMFDTSPALAPPPASLRGSRLARASYVPPPSGSMGQDTLPAQARGFQLHDGPVPNAAPPSGPTESSSTFPGGLRAGQPHARVSSRLAQPPFMPAQQRADALSPVDLQGNNINNRATMFLPPLPASRPGSYYDPPQAPGSAEEDLADVFHRNGGALQRHDSGSNGRDGNLVDFFSRSDES